MKRFCHIILIIATLLAYIEGYAVTFRSIQINEGLSNLDVRSIAQDSQGYIWIGTMRGLNRYNGHEFKHYIFNNEDPNSISSSHVLSVLPLDNGDVLAGTNLGLDLYDARKDNFRSAVTESVGNVWTMIKYDGKIYASSSLGVGVVDVESGEFSLASDNKEKGLFADRFYIDREYNLWCTFFFSNYFARYNRLTNSFEYFTLPDNSRDVTYILPTSSSLFIIGTTKGVEFFDPHTKSFVDVKMYEGMKRLLEQMYIQFIIPRGDNTLWFSTYDKGIYVYNEIRNSFESGYESIASTMEGENYLETFFVDNNENVWLGSDKAGIKLYIKRNEAINFNSELNRLTNNEFIMSITSDREGALLIATRDSGYIYFSKSHQRDANSTNLPQRRMESSRLRAIYADTNNNYWVVTHSKILLRDNKNGETNHRVINTKSPSSASVSIEQIDSTIFICDEREGLFLYNLDGTFIKRISKFGGVLKLIRLDEENLLILSHQGIYKARLDNFEATRLKIDSPLFNSCLNNLVTMYRDTQGTLWAGTYDYGLFKIDLETLKAENYTSQDSRMSNDIIGISEDMYGNIWLSSSLGLAYINHKSGAIQYINTYNDIGNYQYHRNAVFKDRDGVIYFGGNEGLTYMRPLIHNNNGNGNGNGNGKVTPSNVIIESMSILNESIPIGEESILEQAMPFTEQIELQYNDKVISFDIISLNFSSFDKLDYYYKLEGHDNEWIKASSNRRIIYSSLPSGRYKLLVKACNSDGVWTESDTQLEIRVVGPWWFRWWAWCIYAVLVGVVSYITFKLLFNLSFYREELKIEYYERRLIEESFIARRRLFSNIAHELRMPLSIIMGIIHELSSPTIEQSARERIIDTLYSSIDKLVKLVDQLLDINNIEGDSLPLWIKESNINDQIADILKPYYIFVGDKQIDIRFDAKESFTFEYDQDKFDKILNNILSNSIKHTISGFIEVSLTRLTQSEVAQRYKESNPNFEPSAKSYIEISVADSGNGVEDSMKQSIFERYVKGVINKESIYANSGIGLHFTRSLVDLHSGAIMVCDTQGGGATFSFVLPYNISVEACDLSTDIAFTEEQMALAASQGEEQRGRVVLLVEDEPQMNKILKESLSIYYNVLTAYNGIDALEIMEQSRPDLIITDVMMPKMNGLEMVKIIRENVAYNYIPIVILSAKSDVGNRIESLRLGANIFVPKPVHIDHLLSIVASQFNNQQRLSELFLNGLMPKLNSSKVNRSKIDFLHNVNRVLEQELLNPALGIELISERLNMSKSSFHRKFVSMSEMMPNTYIRKYKINKAIELLNHGGYTLSEVATNAGFNSTTYFSTVFKQEQNMSPGEYLKSISQN